MTVRILHGDVIEKLKTLPDNSVHCVVTSPPYWGLRSYLDDDDPNKSKEIGLEPSLGEHLARMVGVFEEVRRVLRKDGTLWLNYGDCYATTPNGRSALATKQAGKDDRTFRDKPFSTVGPILRDSARGPYRRGKSSMQGRHDGSTQTRDICAGGYLKPKDLCMIPNRLAIALQESGWWVRAENVWGKNNPMPDSSGKYRPSSAHEKIFLLTKSGKSYYDAAAVAMPVSENTHARLAQDVAGQIRSARANAGGKTNGNMKAVSNKNLKQDGHSRRDAGFNERYFSQPKTSKAGSGIKNNDSFVEAVCLPTENRYLRNYERAPLRVWEMSTHAFSEAHFATFPPELVERCLLAGCPEGGTVLDPFGGSGTTGLVADRLGRHAILIDLHPKYCAMAERRIHEDAPLFISLKRE